MQVDLLYGMLESIGENCYNILPELSELRGWDCDIYFPINETLSNEILQNNEFTTNLSNWTLDPGISWDHGMLFQCVETDMYAYQSFSTVINQRYRYVARILESDANNKLEIGTTEKSFNIYQSPITTTGVLTGTFVATTTTTFFNLKSTGLDSYSLWDYVSIKKSDSLLNIYNQKDNLFYYNKIPNVSGRFLLLDGNFYTRIILSDKTLDPYTFPSLYILSDNEIDFPENCKVIVKSYNNYVYTFRINRLKASYGRDETMVKLYECIAMESKV